MMQNQRFQEKRYGNWLKVSLSLVYMKESLEDFADDEIKNLHFSIKTNLLQKGCLPIPTGNLCSQHCSAHNIKTLGNGPRKKWELRPPCRFKICNKWLDMIIANHDHQPCPTVSWENTDPQLWPVNPWEIAKVYLPYGCADHQSSNDADVAALLTLMMNCTHFHPFIQHQHMLQRIKDIRNKTMHTNDMLVEDKDMLSDITNILQLLKDPIHFGNLCPEAVNKIEQLRDNKIDLSLNRELELKALLQRTTTIETDMLTMKKGQYSLSDSVDALKSANESRKTECGELKQKIERLEEMEMKVKKVEKDIKHFQDFIRTTGPEFDRIRNTLQTHDTAIHSMSKDISCHATALKKHNICIRKYANILKSHKKELVRLKTKQSIQHVQHNLLKQEQLKLKTEHVKHDAKIKSIERKQNTLEAEQFRIDVTQAEHTVEIDAIKSELGSDKTTFDLKKIREDLCELFRTDQRAQSTISPFDHEDVINIEDIYTELYLIDLPKSNDKPKPEKSGKEDEEDKRRARVRSALYMHELRYKEGKKIENLDEMLVCGEKEFKRVVVQGDAGCGKTTWCNKIVQDWVKINNQKSKTQGTDQPDRNKSEDDFISQFSLVFPLSLSDLSANLDFEQTLKELVFGEDSNINFKGLKQYVFDNPCEVLFLLDGYDECNVTKGFVNGLIENGVLGLHDAWVIVTSRPWKVESLVRKKHISRIIEVRGFNDDNVPLYIKRYMEITGKSDEESSELSEGIIGNLIRLKMYHLAKIPMLLNLICHLNEEGQLEAKTYSGIYKCMLNIYTKRFETKAHLYNLQDQSIETVISQLGKFAWQTLISADPEENSLLFEASKMVKYISQECLNLCQIIGLISKSRTFSSRSRLVTMNFPHRSMHEFLSAYYLSKSDQGNDEVNRYVESVFIGDRDVYKVANTLLFVCGLCRNTGISMLNQLKKHSCITGVQLSTHFLLCCCREIFDKNKEKTNLEIEGIKTLNFANFGKLEQSLVDLCKTSIQTIRLDNFVDYSKVKINLSDLNCLLVLFFDNCVIKNQPMLSNSLKHVVLYSVFMSSITWRMFLRQLSTCHYLTSLQIYYCVDKTTATIQPHRRHEITMPTDDDDVSYMCIAYSSFTSTKFVFPINKHISECRLRDSHFRNEHSDIEDSLQNLHVLRILHIENCSLKYIRLPRLELLTTLNFQYVSLALDVNEALKSLHKCKQLSNIHFDTFCLNQNDIPPFPGKRSMLFSSSTNKDLTFTINRGYLVTPIQQSAESVLAPCFPVDSEIETLHISCSKVSCDIFSTTSLFAHLLEVELVDCVLDVYSLQFPNDTTINTIKITNTTMTVDGCSSIFESIGHMKHLTYCKFHRVTIETLDDRYLNDDNDNKLTGIKSKIVLSHCDFGAASVLLPKLKSECDLFLNSVKMNSNSWKHFFEETRCGNIRNIFIKTCIIPESNFQCLNKEISMFILCNSVLVEKVCESIFTMLGEQKKMIACHLADLSVGTHIDISKRYRVQSSYNGYVIKKCNFGQSKVNLTSFGKALHFEITSVHMSEASREIFSSSSQSDYLEDITIKEHKLTKVRLQFDGLVSLKRISGKNLCVSCFVMPKSVESMTFTDCVFDSNMCFPVPINQIKLTNVRFQLTQSLQSSLDSISNVSITRIDIASMNLKDVRLQIKTKAKNVTLDSVELSENNKNVPLFANQVNAKQINIINTDIQNKLSLSGNIRCLNFKSVLLPEVYNVVNKCILNYQSIRTIEFDSCDLRSANNTVMLPQLVNLTTIVLHKVEMETYNWKSFLVSLSKSEKLNDVCIAYSTVAHFPNEDTREYINNDNVCSIRHCRFKDTDLTLPVLPFITELFFCDIEMGSECWVGLIQSFVNFPSLISIAISNCYVAEGSVVVFPTIKVLKSMRLENVVMKDKSWSNLFVSIRQSNLLQSLRLHLCNCDSLRTDPNIRFDYERKDQKIIEINDCDFGLADIHVPSSIEIGTLTVENTLVSASGWVAFFNSLKSLKNLRTLRFKTCKILASITHFTADIPTSIKHFDLSNVCMVSENWEMLFSTLAELENLNYLNIRCCSDNDSDTTPTDNYEEANTRSADCCIYIINTYFDSSVQRVLHDSLNVLEMSKSVDIRNGRRAI